MPSSASITAALAAGPGQAGDHHVAGLGHRFRRLGPMRAGLQERLRDAGVEIAHGQVVTVAQQAAGQLAADVAEADEPDFHVRLLP